MVSTAKTVSVCVRGSNKLVLEEAGRSIHDALCVIRCLVKTRCSSVLPLLCLGAHAQARYTVACLCVCLSVCVDCYSCSRMNQVQVRVSIGF